MVQKVIHQLLLDVHWRQGSRYPKNPKAHLDTLELELVVDVPMETKSMNDYLYSL
jgi:hypothetical protein